MAGQIYHVDGIVADGHVSFAQPSRYLNTCLDFRNGLPLGSLLLDWDDPRRRQICSFADRCIAALSLDNSAFHLELIEGMDGRLYFLEIGARVGGGEIPFLIKELLDVDLVQEWINAELGISSRRLSLPRAQANSGGFLMIPEPPNAPREVIAASSLAGIISEISWEAIPAVGDVLDGTGGYSRIGGRFRFQGLNAHQVEIAMRRAIDVFKLEVRSVSTASTAP